MTLPDEFLDVFAGTTTLDRPATTPEPDTTPEPGSTPEPGTGPDADPGDLGPAAPLVAAPAADGVSDERPATGLRSPAPGTFPAPPGPPRMGPEAKDLPALDAPELPDLGAGTPAVGQRDLRLLADVQVELAVELGRVKLPLRELLALGPGAVLELDRAADAPVDVLVNGCLVARGEVVVIDGEFGVRVTAVVER